MTLTLNKNLVYVVRDIERALGMEPGQHGQGDYHIVSNDTAYGREIQKAHPKHVLLVASTKPETAQLDTFDLLSLPEVQAYIENLDADLVVFQNNSRVERLAADREWSLINPSAALSKKIEDKISQVEWLGEDSSLLPSHQITLVRHVRLTQKKLVIQFNHAHTGQGTHVIEPTKDGAQILADLQTRFPDRECRVTDFIDGPIFTLNALVGSASARMAFGNVSYQITGLSPFTDMPFATVGNDWALPQSEPYAKAVADTKDIAQVIAARLEGEDWRGLFGIDVVLDTKTNKTYLLEINARQPASTTYESQLQKRSRADKMSIFEAHVAALLGTDIDENTANITGAQIIQRVTKTSRRADIPALQSKNLTVISYENAADKAKAHNKELFRIQSAEGIMKSPGELNELGTFIASCIQHQ